jgi:acyl carrier protein
MFTRARNWLAPCGLTVSLLIACRTAPDEPSGSKPAPISMTDTSTPVSASKRQVSPPAEPAPSSGLPQTLPRVRKVASQILRIPEGQLPDDTSLAALPKPADDLDIVEIVLGLEEEFHIDIPDDAIIPSGKPRAEEISSHLTVRMLANIVDQQVRRRSELNSHGSPSTGSSPANKKTTR